MSRGNENARSARVIPSGLTVEPTTENERLTESQSLIGSPKSSGVSKQKGRPLLFEKLAKRHPLSPAKKPRPLLHRHRLRRTGLRRSRRDYRRGTSCHRRRMSGHSASADGCALSCADVDRADAARAICGRGDAGDEKQSGRGEKQSESHLVTSMRKESGRKLTSPHRVKLPVN